MPSPNKPVVSIVLLAYNQEKFIREAVEGAFSQTYSPLEIILSDDCSKDRTFDIMQEMAAAYQGPHKIVLNRNPKNLGLGRHYNRVMELASGEIVELAAGDDISLPHRTTKSVELFLQYPEFVAISLGLCVFSGDRKDIKTRHCTNADLEPFDSSRYMWDPHYHLNAPARAFKKFTHDFFGPLCEDCPVDDGSNLLRCLLLGPAGYCNVTSVLYRRHPDNITSADNGLKIRYDLLLKEDLHVLETALAKSVLSKQQYLNIAEQMKRKKIRFDISQGFKRQKLRTLPLLLRSLLGNKFAAHEKKAILDEAIRDFALVRDAGMLWRSRFKPRTNQTKR